MNLTELDEDKDEDKKQNTCDINSRDIKGSLEQITQTADRVGDDESVLSSTCTVATTTSYIHGDRATVKRLVAGGLRKKQQQMQRRVRPRNEGKVGPGKKGTKNKGKRDLQWSMDPSGW